MSDLVTWLRATIEGNLAAARALDGHAWRVDEEGCGWFFISQDEGDPLAKSCGCCSVGTLTREQAEHIVLQQPRDTIARCEFELAEVARHEQGPCYDCMVCSDHEADYPCSYLRRLAYCYRHREGYRPEWAPEE